MVKVKIGNQEIYLDGLLKTNLDLLKKLVSQDRDAIIIVDGVEREGKSTFAHQIMFYLDPNYSLDRTTFTAEQFIQKIKESKKNQGVIFDECHGYLNSRQALSRFNRTLIQVMAEMGSRNLYVIMCLPSFFELDKYAAIHRSICLLHIYTGKHGERGFFQFYSRNKKKFLYLYGKKYYSYAKPRSDFYGRFTKKFPFDYEEYQKRKTESILTSSIDRSLSSDLSSRFKKQRDALIKLKYEEGLTQQEIANCLKEKSGITISRSEISYILSEKR